MNPGQRTSGTFHRVEDDAVMPNLACEASEMFVRARRLPTRVATSNQSETGIQIILVVMVVEC